MDDEEWRFAALGTFALTMAISAQRLHGLWGVLGVFVFCWAYAGFWGAVAHVLRRNKELGS